MHRKTLVCGLALAWIVLVTAGCSQSQPVGPGKQPPAKAEPKPRVSVQAAPARIGFWRLADGSVRVENTLSRPIALFSVALRTESGRLVAQGGGQGMAATAAGDGAAVEGTLLIDDPGPQARAKFPDRWQWRGKGTLMHFPVLRPGQTFSVAGQFRLTDKTGRRLTASVRYAELTGDVALLSQAERSLKSLPPPAGGTFGKGWVPTRRMTVTYRKADRIAKFPHRKSLWGEGPRAAALPAHYAHALLKPAYDALARDKGKSVRAERALEVDGPKLSLAEARKQAGAAAGAYTYWPPRSAWVLEAKNATHFVGPAGKQTHAGRLVPLVEALTRREPVELELFSQARSKDPGGHVAALSKQGFKAKTQIEKGQTHRGSVTVRRAELDKLLKALTKRGLRVEGLRVR